MQTTPARNTIRKPVGVLALLVVAHLTAGCAASSARTEAAPATPAHDLRSESTQVIRYGRYTLVELVPDAPQQDLMQQVIDLTLPATANTTVADAVRYILLRSGYQLCADRDETNVLNSLPLPAAHNHLGPLVLRDALQVLVGRTWKLEVDEGTRTVCFAHGADLAVGASTGAILERKP